MDKVTIDIPRKEDGKWGSYISKYPQDSSRVPPNALTINSRNMISSATGMGEKRTGGAIWNANSVLGHAALDQYEGIFASGSRLLLVNDAGTLKASTGTGLFSTITGGTGYTNPANFEFATYQGRVYGCNGVDAPIVIDTATAYGGVSYSFTTAKTKVMGAQAPVSAATAARVTDSTANQVPAASHRYKITFVYYNGVEESNAGPVSAVCVNDATHTSNALTAIPVGGYGVTARNIYRDNNDGNFLLLDTISNNTATTYTDILVIGGTPVPLLISNNVPGVFKYIALFLDRLFVIDVTGKTIAWSVAGQPDVFLPDNAISGPQDDVMTGIYIFNGIPYVFGQHTVGTIQGTTDGTFYYSQLSQTVGCVDNRSIQTRSIVSVPTLLWLAATPNKGIYYTNGSIVQYLSDFIEDLTFNLAQVGYLERLNTQNSLTAFQADTASEGIDLASNPGAIETINPTVSYSNAIDWATGTLVNAAVVGDQLQVPTAFAPSVASGVLGGGAQASGSNVVLGVSSPWSGDSIGTGGGTNTQSAVAIGNWNGQQVAVPYEPPVSGSLTGFTFVGWANWILGQISGGAKAITFTVWGDSLGQPGSVLYSQSISTPDSWNGVVSGLSVLMAAGTRYWIGLQFTNYAAGTVVIGWNTQTARPVGGLADATAQYFNGVWNALLSGGLHTTYAHSSTFTATAVPSSGSWASPVYDTHSTSIQSSSMTATLAGTYPAGCSVSVAVQGSNDLSAWTTTDTLLNPDGAFSLTGGTYRYWRFIYTLASTDNTVTPTVSVPVLKFATTATWTSPVITCTSDITTLDALIKGSIVPAGTTVTLLIATSTDNITYSSYVALASAVAHKYAKIKATLTADGTDTSTPTLVSVELDWTVAATLISSAIDTGANPPAGWGIFQYNEIGMAGSVAFFFRTAATSGALSAASWLAVSNGGYPTNTVLEFCQWKAQMTGHANDIPVVNSVTINWLLTSGTNVRAASLFFNKSYYLSVATTGNTQNNLLIELDYEGNWRVHAVNIGTMGLYFNDAFYCDSTNGNVLNAFKLPTDNGTPIVFDLRTKAFDLGDNLRLKTIRSCKVTGVNTGTTIHVYYSVDRGATWIEMLNSSGATGYATNNNGAQFIEYFVPNFNGASPTSGPTAMFRVVSSDSSPCQILQVSPTLFMHKGKAVREAMA